MRQTQARDDGIDMLRSLSMLMIVCLHVLSQGGVLVRYSDRPSTYQVSWLLETACFCAVNCYGLISGYVGVKAKWRLGRIIELWLTVFFYSAGITGLYALLGGDQITGTILAKSLLPVSGKTYWYFSGYAALFFLMPFLNRMVLSLDQAGRRGLMLVLFLVFSVGTTIPKAFQVDFLELIGGYSLIWLIVLYLMGACLRLLPRRDIKRRSYVLGYLLMTAVSWGFKIGMEAITRSVFGEARYARMLITYTAPTILLCGVCLLQAFARLHLQSRIARRINRLLASTCFSVYLIHAQPVIWTYVLKGAFRSYGRLGAAWVLGPTILTALGIYLLCTAADLVRLGIFKLLRVGRLTLTLGAALEKGTCAWMRREGHPITRGKGGRSHAD